MERLERAANKGKDITPHILRLKEEGAIIRLKSPFTNDPLNQTYTVAVRTGDKYIVIRISQKLYHTLKELLYEDN